jgi:hypothetical protein
MLESLVTLVTVSVTDLVRNKLIYITRNTITASLVNLA